MSASDIRLSASKGKNREENGSVSDKGEEEEGQTEDNIECPEVDIGDPADAWEEEDRGDSDAEKRSGFLALLCSTEGQWTSKATFVLFAISFACLIVCLVHHELTAEGGEGFVETDL